MNMPKILNNQYGRCEEIQLRTAVNGGVTMSYS